MGGFAFSKHDRREVGSKWHVVRNGSSLARRTRTHLSSHSARMGSFTWCCRDGPELRVCRDCLRDQARALDRPIQKEIVASRLQFGHSLDCREKNNDNACPSQKTRLSVLRCSGPLSFAREVKILLRPASDDGYWTFAVVHRIWLGYFATMRRHLPVSFDDGSGSSAGFSLRIR